MAEDLQVILSGDGSHTLFVPSLDEHFHSVNGALQESEHVFINAGYNFIDKDQVNILEIGFGTGLNTFLTCLKADDQKKQIIYTALEPFPLDRSIWSKLNYPDLLQNPNAGHTFQKIHEAEWEKEVRINKNFKIIKRKKTLEKIILPNALYDLVYFDAFAPGVNPELWTKDIFIKVYKYA